MAHIISLYLFVNLIFGFLLGVIVAGLNQESYYSALQRVLLYLKCIEGPDFESHRNGIQ